MAAKSAQAQLLLGVTQGRERTPRRYAGSATPGRAHLCPQHGQHEPSKAGA
jgi:hypothetical protein